MKLNRFQFTSDPQPCQSPPRARKENTCGPAVGVVERTLDWKSEGPDPQPYAATKALRALDLAPPFPGLQFPHLLNEC